jgi:transcriptional regulator with XRE-family HTH domain
MLMLKEIRKNRGYTQEKMASFLNMTQAAYSKLEREEYKMNVEMLCKLADILVCSTDELLNRDVKRILELNKEVYQKK